MQAVPQSQTFLHIKTPFQAALNTAPEIMPYFPRECKKKPLRNPKRFFDF